MQDKPGRVVSVLAPAKVNLALHILGRRADGYHELDSLLFPVSVYDRLELAVGPAERMRVRCSVVGPEKVGGGRANLASRAAVAVMGHLGVAADVRIRLTKEIPAGAGLGGGSSDAAAVLRVLPRLLGRRVGAAALARLALGLGADVPFLLACRPARATGIGEILSPLPTAPSGAMVILVPTERVETRWAYAHALPRLTSGRVAPSVRRFPRSLDDVETWCSNDFQRGVEATFGSVRIARERLQALGARAAVLSGSGSAVVGWFPDQAEARRAAAQCQGPEKIFVAQVLRGAPRPRFTPA